MTTYIRAPDLIFRVIELSLHQSSSAATNAEWRGLGMKNAASEMKPAVTIGGTFAITRIVSATGLYALSALATLAAFADISHAGQPAGNVTEARVLAEASDGRNWLVNGGNFGSQHFSPLKQINSQNVTGLGLAWATELDSPNGMASEPIVVDGTIYISASLDRISAVDAGSGRLLWTFDPKVRLDRARNSLTARTNRGVAVWEGKVFFGTGDCRMIALDAATGKPLWESPACVDDTITGITGAPRVGDGKVYIGTNGSDSSVRGSVVAFDASTGRLAWRIWTVPGDPSKGFENKSMEMAAKTWSGNKWWTAGGADVWDALTYDPTTGLLFLGTAGPGEGPDRAVETSGDRLFSGSILAVKADTGTYAWHYQTSKNSTCDSPENFHIVATDLLVHGTPRHIVMTVPRCADFFVLDAKTGKLISRKSLNDRPAEQRSSPTPSGQARDMAGHNWWPMSYNPATGLVYISIYDDVANDPGYLPEAAGRLMAWEPVTQTARWSHQLRFPTNGGVLSTAGNLVFQGEGTGEFSAYRADSGKKLWSIKTGSAIQSIPVTFMVNNVQYVLIPVGMGGMSRNFNGTSVMATPETRRGPSRLLAFRLGGTVPFPYPTIVLPAVPKPPEQTASAEVIKTGSRLFVQYTCENCHSPQADGAGAWVLNGAIPDLRYMPADVHDQFFAIILGGSRRNYGMPGFADGIPNYPLVSVRMSVVEAQAIHAYIVELQWKAYKADQERRAAKPEAKVGVAH
jgi:quinohemoprotein ethanol dehydrogenase